MLNSECLNKFNAALNYQNKNKIVIKVKAQNDNNKQNKYFILRESHKMHRKA